MKTHRITPLFVFTLSLLLLAGCKKHKARKTLVGNWNVVFYDATLYDECQGFENTFVGGSRIYGNAEFEKGRFSLSYRFDDEADVDDDPQCIPEYNEAGEWKVTSHDQELLVMHLYKIELDGHTWDLVFEESQRTYVKADGNQGMISLSTSFENGDEVYLGLVRE